MLFVVVLACTGLLHPHKVQENLVPLSASFKEVFAFAFTHGLEQLKSDHRMSKLLRNLEEVLPPETVMRTLRVENEEGSSPFEITQVGGF